MLSYLKVDLSNRTSAKVIIVLYKAICLLLIVRFWRVWTEPLRSMILRSPRFPSDSWPDFCHRGFTPAWAFPSTLFGKPPRLLFTSISFWNLCLFKRLIKVEWLKLTRIDDWRHIYWFFFQILCRQGVSARKLPQIPFANEVLYACGTSILFHLAVVRPHHLKPSYFKFMNRITGNR